MIDSTTTEALMVLSFLVPLSLGPLMFKLEGKRADAFMLLVVSLSTALNLSGAFLFWNDGMHTVHGVFLRVNGLGEVYGLIVDPMSVLIGIVIVTAGILFMAYSIDYMGPGNRGHPVVSGKGRFYAWMTIFIGSTLAFVYSSTVLQLLIFFEIMSLACWGVVGHYRTERAKRAAYKAFIVTNFGAMVGLYTAVGVGIVNLHDLSLYSLGSLSPHLKLLVFLAVMVAAFTKSAQFPFYSWLPDAMEAPTPASAFLHGAAMVEMGVFLLARFIQFMGPIPKTGFYTMAGLIIITQVVSMAMYPIQRDAKRLLAYSTVAESSVMYIALAAALLNVQRGISAAMFQLFNHAYVKGLAFLSVGAFSYVFGTIDMGKLRGLMKLPVVGYCWTFAMLGLAGVPPFGVFFGKVAILTTASALKASVLMIVMLVLLLADSVVFLMVSLKRSHEMVLSQTNEGMGRDLTGLMKLSMIILAVLAVVAPLIAYPLMRGMGW